MQEQEKEALRHFLRFGESFTGKRVAAEYKQLKTEDPTRNKF